jgi:hypothetical protein
MARLVLRAALEQRRTQQAIEHAGFPPAAPRKSRPPKARGPAGTPVGEPTCLPATSDLHARARL